MKKRKSVRDSNWNKTVVFFSLLTWGLTFPVVCRAATELEPLDSLMGRLVEKDKRAYVEFCQRISKFHEELNMLFQSDTSQVMDPAASWQSICHEARLQITVKRPEILAMPAGGSYEQDAVWSNMGAKFLVYVDKMP
ncbi:MAG: hypothetical protein CSA81_02830 [Acidobacteria bacterium]|nr:MAG: hypothetical protein CSA81_02830 [Acidobacteriota bacterium]